MEQTLQTSGGDVLVRQSFFVVRGLQSRELEMAGEKGV
jgi:hypothetical protein